MKKLLLIGVALFAVVMFITPVSATELKLGGYYRIEGRIQGNPQLDEDLNAGGDHWRMRFRFQPAFIVSDALRFDMKFDLFDGTSFGADGPKAKSVVGRLDIDRLWMTITVPFGKFAGGRMAGGEWGLTFGNDGEDYDRVRFDTTFGDFTTGVILQKNIEADWGSATQADADSDTYYLYGNYKAGFGSIGLLGAYTIAKNVVTQETTKYNLLPYFDLRFGMVGVRGELIWGSGEVEFDAPGATDIDISELAWNLEADVTFGPFTILGGYAWVQGDEDAADDEIQETNLQYGGIGDDWDLLVVMMDVDQLINGHALAAPGTSIMGASGVELAYVEFQWKATREWKFWATVGYAQAQELGQFPAGTDDEIGWEYDVNAQWQVMKNLKALFRFGYFKTGEFWENAVGITNIDDTYTAYHQWTLSF